MAASAEGTRLLDRWGPAQHPILWICGVHIALALLLFDPKPFLGGDNYWYMLLGESLRSGEGLRDLWLPDMPAHTRYGPVYPGLLAVFGIAGSSIILFKLLSLAFTTGIAALVFLVAEKRTGDRQLALFAGLLAASAPIIVEYAHWILSEPAFTFFLMVAVYSFTRDPKGEDARLFAIGTAAVILASLTRSAGYPLILAVAITLAARQSWKRLAIYGAAVVVVLGAWWLRNKTQVSGDLAYTQWMLFRDPYNPELGTVTFSELIGRLFYNMKVYTITVLPRSLGGRDLSAEIAGTIGIVSGALIVIGALVRIKKLEIIELLFVFYMGLILLWPESWTDQRLLLPLLPVAIVLLMEGLRWSIKKWAGKGAAWIPNAYFALAVVIVGIAAFANVRIMARELNCSRQYWRGNHYACYPPNVVDFMETAVWTGQNTEPDVVVINRKPQIFYWYARRRGDNYPYTQDTDSVMRFFDSVDAKYVIIDRWSSTATRFLIPALQANANKFRIVHMEGDPPTAVAAYLPGGSP
jgi:hypothetical protein